MPDRLAVYSVVGLFVFAVVLKFFFIDYMFPNASLHTIQDPWVLSPALLFAVVITGVRFAIYEAFRSRGNEFAQNQIELAKPNWVQNSMRKDNENKNNNTTKNGMNGHTTSSNGSNGSNSSTCSSDASDTSNSSASGTKNKNEGGNTLLSQKDMNRLLATAENKNLSMPDLFKLGQDLSLSRSQISSIKSYRKAVLEVEGSVNKYLEVHFKLLMTVAIMCCGIYVVALRDSAFYHPESLYSGKNKHPPQHHDSFMLFYYWISLGYHTHRSAFQFFNHKQKDFWAMFIHHWATICLISLSWISGFCETGCLIMFLHDNGDVWLPLAKLFRYNGWQKATDLCFVIFTVTWCIFRMYWFFSVVYVTWDVGGEVYVLTHPWGFVCFSLLVVLQCLHCYWFVLIMTIVKNLIFFGGKVDDIRSEENQNAAKSKED